MMRVLVLLLYLFSVAVSASIPNNPPNAKLYLPTLKQELVTYWPEIKPYSVFAAQVEQESCISLKHKRCWNPKVELKTSREYGFGLGQLTVTSKFNAYEEVKRLDKSMASWKWEDRFNPSYQLRAIVLKNRSNYNRLKGFSKDPDTVLAFTMAAYNGGVGGLMKDRTLCIYTKGCDPTKWWGNVERTSNKSKVPVKGYGMSFFDINREYVRHTIRLKPRRAKYVPYMDSG
jgi:hypothetical protein